MTEVTERPVDNSGYTPITHKRMLVDGPGAGFHLTCSCGEPPAENELAGAIIADTITELLAKYRPLIPNKVELAIDEAQTYLLERLAWTGGARPRQYVDRDNAALINWLCDDHREQGPVDDALRHPSGEGPLATATRELRRYRATLPCGGQA